MFDIYFGVGKQRKVKDFDAYFGILTSKKFWIRKRKKIKFKLYKFFLKIGRINGLIRILNYTESGEILENKKN